MASCKVISKDWELGLTVTLSFFQVVESPRHLMGDLGLLMTEVILYLEQK